MNKPHATAPVAPSARRITAVIGTVPPTPAVPYSEAAVILGGRPEDGEELRRHLNPSRVVALAVPPGKPVA